MSARILAAALAGCVLAGAPAPSARSQEPAQLEELRSELERVRDEYERRLAELEGALERVQARQAAVEAAPPAPAPPAPAPSGGRDRSFNPDISLIGDFLIAATDEPGVERDVDLGLSEIEIGFQGVIDPYVRFDVFAAFHEHSDEAPLGLPLAFAEHGHEDDEHADEDEAHSEDEHGSGLEVELEEAVLTTLALPGGLQVRAGRFRQPMGRQNLVHLPEDPWADQPTVNRAFFGDDQLIDDGLQLSWLLPTPFYWELAGTITRGPSESPTFTRSEDDDFLHVLHSRWFADFSDTTSAQIGASWATGPADEHGRESSEVAGIDFTLKWTPSAYRGLTWQSEVFWRDRPIPWGGHGDDDHDDDHDDEHEYSLLVALGDDDHDEDHDDDHDDEHGEDEVFATLSDWGFYTWLDARLSKRWQLGLRVDHVDYDDEFFEDEVDDRWDASLVATFRPTEYQALRVQAKQTWDDLAEDEYFTVYLNWVWSLGAHGAHPY